jgi:putative addiction module CopG family antidote
MAKARDSVSDELPADVARAAAGIVAADPSQYPNIEAVVRAGIQAVERTEKRRAAKVEALREALLEGENSGEAPDGVFDRVSAKLGLPLAPR